MTVIFFLSLLLPPGVAIDGPGIAASEPRRAVPAIIIAEPASEAAFCAARPRNLGGGTGDAAFLEEGDGPEGPDTISAGASCVAFTPPADESRITGRQAPSRRRFSDRSSVLRC